MKYRYVFDLDNTLIYTDILNNDSYNYALIKLGLFPIHNCKRITRRVVLEHYPYLDIQQQTELTELKQAYFFGHVSQTDPNVDLFGVLHTYDPQFCALWTSAEKRRVLHILEYYHLQNAFTEICYSSKKNIRRDIEDMCKLFYCTSQQLIFYEDSNVVIEKLRSLGQTVIAV